MQNVHAMIARLDWDAYNKTGNLKEAIERYKNRYGFCQERFLADKIYLNRSNLQYCDSLNIRMNGPKHRRPTSDKRVYANKISWSGWKTVNGTQWSANSAKESGAKVSIG